MSQDQLQFIDYCKPTLEAGEYTFSVKNQYEDIAESISVTSGNATEKEHTIHVSGERTSIKEACIYSRFPARGQTGNFSNVIPHITLNKSALPWSRSLSIASSDDDPWLYLMLINEHDIANGLATEPKSGTFQNLSNPEEDIYFPAFQAKSLADDAQLTNDDKSITYVDVDIDLFKKLVASQLQYLKKLAHVRRRFKLETDVDIFEGLEDNDIALLNSKDTGVLEKFTIEEKDSLISFITADSWLVQTVEGDFLLELSTINEKKCVTKFSLNRESAVLLANRITLSDPDNYPQGLRHYSLLISLENYLDGGEIDVGSAKKVRLLVMTHWWFNSTSKDVDFHSRCSKLDVDSLRLPAESINNVSGFDVQLQSGLTGLAHNFRLGDNSVSWYRGPLIPCETNSFDSIHLTEKQLGKTGEKYEPTDADKLLVYLKDDGMFDISYAAAYEIGRFLSLSQSGFSKAIINYKRKNSRYVKLVTEDQVRKDAAGNAGINIVNLPYAKLNDNSTAAELLIIENWLLNLAKLKNIPSWYLVPDKNLLPKPSLRMFNTDPKWIESLWLGALSLGGRPKETYDLFQKIHTDLSHKVPRFGMFVRSDIVWAYPELETTMAYNDDMISEMDIALDTRFSHDIQLYLSYKAFDKTILALPVESLHYGIEDGEQMQKSVIKDGKEIAKVPVPFDRDDLTIIDIKQLCKNLNSEITNSTLVDKAYKNSLEHDSMTSSQLGRYLIESESKIEFKLGAST